MDLATVPQVLDDIRSGNMTILVDDEQRENEGDLVLAAQMVTPSAINFMLTYARGFICTPIADELAEHLDLHPMVEENQCPLQTPFTVTIDAREGISTGVSVYDRSVTIQKMASEEAGPEDFVRPGHVFPLRAAPGGVMERPGHTEGSVELMRLAGLRPVAVISEIMNPDGSMAGATELAAFARRHGLKVCSIREIMSFLGK